MIPSDPWNWYRTQKYNPKESAWLKESKVWESFLWEKKKSMGEIPLQGKEGIKGILQPQTEKKGGSQKKKKSMNKKKMTSTLTPKKVPETWWRNLQDNEESTGPAGLL